MKLQAFLDLGFTIAPIIFVKLWFAQTLLTVLSTNNWYGSTNLFLFGNIHSLTVISICFLYLILFIIFYKNTTIPVYMRVVIIATIISFGLQFNGIIWSTLNLYIGSKTGMPQLNLAFTFLIGVVLFGLHRVYNIIHIHHRTMLILVGLFLISIALYIDSGFFYQWNLCEQGLAPDPHNWQWGLEQFIGVWLWVGIIKFEHK